MWVFQRPLSLVTSSVYSRYPQAVCPSWQPPPLLSPLPHPSLAQSLINHQGQSALPPKVSLLFPLLHPPILHWPGSHFPDTILVPCSSPHSPWPGNPFHAIPPSDSGYTLHPPLPPTGSSSLAATPHTQRSGGRRGEKKDGLKYPHRGRNRV